MAEEWLSPSARAEFLPSAAGQVRGDPESRGLFVNGEFGLQRGIVLSTGRAAFIAGGALDTVADDFGPEGPAGDTAGLSLSFTSTRAARLWFEYVFATRELPAFDGRPVTDWYVSCRPVELQSLAVNGNSDGNYFSASRFSSTERLHLFSQMEGQSLSTR